MWAEAGGDNATAGGPKQGTSWIVRLLPYLEATNIYNNWSFINNVAGNGVLNGTVTGPNGTAMICQAQTEIKALYCPTRRPGFRPGTGADGAMMIGRGSTTGPWAGGGTDYGGCAGRLAWSTDSDHMMYDSSTQSGCNPQGNPPGNPPTTAGAGGPYGLMAISDSTASKHWGIFGQVNYCATMASIRDGSTNTFLLGELQRFTSTSSATNLPIVDISHDGWAVGGDATLFSTAAINPKALTAGPMNNGYFASPGSEHSGGAQFGMGDASVRFVSSTVDPGLFALLGSMADNVSAQAP